MFDGKEDDDLKATIAAWAGDLEPQAPPPVVWT